jgi:hypothetical protein
MTRVGAINVYGPYKRGERWRVVLKSGSVQQADSFPTEAEAIAHRDSLCREIGRPSSIVDSLTASLDQWVALLMACGSAGPFVYAVRPVVGGLTKIGVAGDPMSRLVDIQHMCPVPLRVVGLAHGGFDVEGALHREYGEYHSHGEWFDLKWPPLTFANGICAGCARKEPASR